jgi:RHS repeat-associated protein
VARWRAALISSVASAVGRWTKVRGRRAVQRYSPAMAVLRVALLAVLVFAIVLPAGAQESSGAASWGLNNDGQLGNGTTTTAKEAAAVKVLTEATAVAAGELHSLALLKSGKVMAWGYNADGQLGNGTTTNATEPVDVKGISEAVAIAAGADHSLALLKNGKVMAWGYNIDGQLGNGTTTNAKEPVEVKGLSEAVAIAAGKFHSLAVLKNGKVMAWGDNNDGQLGNGTTTTAKEPVEVKGLTEASAVAGGEFHSLALLKSGKAKAWGFNKEGQLGNGTTTTAKEPVEVKGLTEAVGVGAGSSHSLAVLASGKVKAWGANNDGQLGNGTTTAAKEPAEVKGLTEASAVAGGEFHSLALLKSGKVMAWGYNVDGQLGNGTTTTAKEAVEAKGLKGAVGTVAAGANFSLASYASGPANTEPPTISGEAKDEKTLTASTGAWTGTPPLAYAYQWQSCNSSGESCATIAGATSSTYAIAHEQVGHTIRVKVTATNAAGAAAATSAATGTVAGYPPANTKVPTISGEAKEGQTLTAGAGEWTGSPPLSYTYQWRSCNALGEGCMDIAGATSSTYTLGPSDVGTTLRVTVTATNAAGSASSTSQATGEVVETPCSDTWVGGSESSWEIASNWSAGRVPGPGDGACIKSGVTVKVTSAGDGAGALVDEGTLVLAGGTLELANAAKTSSVSALRLEGGTLVSAGALDVGGLTQTGGALAGTGTVEVEASFTWTGGTMSGAGKTVIAPGVSAGVISTATLSERTLINEGRLSFEAGTIVMSEGARLENKGTFYANSEEQRESEPPDISVASGSKSQPSIVNTGSFEKTSFNQYAGRGTSIGVSFTNEGALKSVARGGGLALLDGGSSGAAGEWAVAEGAGLILKGGSFSMLGGRWSGPGSLTVSGASVTAEGVQAATANVSLQPNASLTIPAGTLSVAAFSMREATLTGAGTLAVTSSFAWKEGTGGTMSGSGKTLLGPGATGALAVAGATISERTLVNEGTLTQEWGNLLMSEGARLENKGTFNVNSEAQQQESEPADISVAPASFMPPVIVNTGTLQKTYFDQFVIRPTTVAVSVANEGTVESAAPFGVLRFVGSATSGPAAEWLAAENAALSFAGGTSFDLAGKWAGATTLVKGANVKVENVQSQNIKLTVESGSLLTIANGEVSASTLHLHKATITGAGTLNVSSSFAWEQEGLMSGSGTTVLRPGSTANTENGGPGALSQRTLINEGTFAFEWGALAMANGATLYNNGTFLMNSEKEGKAPGETSDIYESFGGGAIINTGKFEKTYEDPYVERPTTVGVPFVNHGIVGYGAGKLEILDPVVAEVPTQYGGPEGNLSAPGHPHATCGKPVSCATGNESETQTDFAIGGRGVGLDLKRTYNSRAAAEGTHGPFGYGWTSSFSDHLTVETETHKATLHQADGSAVPFTESGGSFTAPAWSQDKLSGSSEAGYTLTYPDRTRYEFSGASGRLESVTDRNGNSTTLSYNGSGQLEAITDPAGRKITFAYTPEGLVQSARDPMGHEAKYAYEGGNLASVTEPSEASPRWQFKYDGSHQLTEMTDGRGGKTINEYNPAHQVIKQTDPLKRELSFEYEPFHTRITNRTSGAVTDEIFTSEDEPVAITRGYGTSLATTESFTYDEGGYVTSVTDGNNHTTKYGYDSENNRMSMLDANEHETKWGYDSAHDVTSTTTPKGETTTIKRDSDGNPEVIERPAPGGQTQTTKYKYDSHGELESVEDPLKRVWNYEYDVQGDRTAEIDPEGDKRTWKYDEDSFETSSVSPRGNGEGGEPAKYTTRIERDQQERPTKVTDPLGHATQYTYDGNGNLETLTDPNGHTTTYTYDADNERLKVKEPSGATTETEYDGAGNVTAQIDGNKHATKYARNVLGQVREVIDPLSHSTTKEYDAAGNLERLTDPLKRATTFKYDPANRLTEVSYSDGKTHSVTYEYDADGNRTKMIDGTGTTTYSYDQLDRLTESKDGHGDTIGYEYDLANEQTRLTYPNGKPVTRAYDNTGRLHRVTDWLEHTTRFAYDPDSNVKATTWPTGTSAEDSYAYNEADQLTKTEMKHGAEVLASLTYARDRDGQVESSNQSGLPGEEQTSYTYDENSRLTKVGATEYEYDSADNPTRTGSSINTYNAADELERGTGASYSYDELGQRTTTTPTTGPATTYSYDQAGDLTSVSRPKEGETSEIEDSYSYDGNGLRASQTIGAATSHLSWDVSASLPLLISDASNSYIYGPGNLPIEQISSGGTVLYLHHDQQGSTRLLTGETGSAEVTFTYSAYGELTGKTGIATTPLSYDGEYTSAASGLIYLRVRSYDPTTGQFTSVDPLLSFTGTPYGYAGDNPVNGWDPLGLICFGPSILCEAAKAVGHAFTHPVQTIENGVTAAWNAVKVLNPVPYYEAEIRGYENGCGYWSSVIQGLKGAAVAATDVYLAGPAVDVAKELVPELGLRARGLQFLQRWLEHPVWGQERYVNMARGIVEYVIHHMPR